MAALTGVSSLRPSPAFESITDLLYQNFNLQIEKAISTSNFSGLEAQINDYITIMEKAPHHLENLVEQGSFYPVLIKYVSLGQYESIAKFIEEFMNMPNSDLFITYDIVLCCLACRLAIDPHGSDDVCNQAIQDCLLDYPGLYQHFEKLMLSDSRYTEFYRPLGQFFK